MRFILLIVALSLIPAVPYALPARPLNHLASIQQFRLGRLRITGNIHTKQEFILWLIPLNEGDLFDRSKWEFGLKQISRTGLFEPIAPDDVVMTFDNVNGIVDVELRLKERDWQRLDLSGGAGTSGGSSLALDYSNFNLTGRGDTARARGVLGTRERTFGAGYGITTLTKTPITIDISGSYQRAIFVDARAADQNTQPLFVQRSAGASAGFSVPLGRSPYTFAAPLRTGLTYSFSSTDLTDTLTGAPVGSLEQSGIRTGALTSSLVHYTLDREFDPIRGQALSVSIELGARSLGGSFNSLRPSLDYRLFVPLGSRASENAGGREPEVFGMRVRVSHISAVGKRFTPRALSAVGGIQLFKRFFLGGETEVRGYDVNAIGPLARVDRLFALSDGEPTLVESDLRPVGGDTRIIFNSEYRVPLAWRFSAAAFIDIGASFNVKRLRQETFESQIEVAPLNTPGTILTVIRPRDATDPNLPIYRASVGAELRFNIPRLNVPLRFIFAANPNAQRGLPSSVLLAPEKRFVFRVGFSRTL